MHYEEWDEVIRSNVRGYEARNNPNADAEFWSDRDRLNATYSGGRIGRFEYSHSRMSDRRIREGSFEK